MNSYINANLPIGGAGLNPIDRDNVKKTKDLQFNTSNSMFPIAHMVPRLVFLPYAV